VHCAGSTTFHRQARNEPFRTNVEGTVAMLEWARKNGCRKFHLLSTAYVAGQRGVLKEQALEAADPESFNNVYEESKHLAERAVLSWITAGAGTATIFRPAICAGHSVTGRATSYQGFYRLARATQLLAGMANGDRREIALRIRGRPDQRQHIVPVDHIAAVIAAVVLQDGWHGGFYNLTHPDPPDNCQIKTWLEECFDIGGGRFVDPDENLGPLNEVERLFYELVAPITPYFFRSRGFERQRTSEIEAATRLACPRLDVVMIRRWIDWATAARWGRTAPADGFDRKMCAAYFELFLARNVPRSRLAAMTRLTTAAAFCIGGAGGYRCVCRFEHGRLVQVHTGGCEAADFGYQASYTVFLEAITGRIRPQELFFERGAEIDGDVERALKMAAILHEFTREFPCSEGQLRRMVRSAG
jgi:nucleoside-diphosphate-sugar epimerase